MTAFANQLMTIAQQALTRLEGNTGAHLVRPIRIYIYASAQDLQGAMIFPEEWTGGVAFTEYGIVAIGIAPDNLAWGQTAIAHELTHLVVHQMTFNPYNELPTWLDEGLAVYNQGPLDPPIYGPSESGDCQQSAYFTAQPEQSVFSLWQ